MNEADVQQSLWAHRHRDKPIVPNIYLYAWESDLVSVTKAGYVQEFEIKLTAPDFRHDLKKIGKHQILANPHAASNRPNNFWYVTQQGITVLEAIPHYAGWIEFAPHPRSPGRYIFMKRKNAPRLHRTLITERQRQQLLWSCYYRFWDLRSSLAFQRLEKALAAAAEVIE